MNYEARRYGGKFFAKDSSSMLGEIVKRWLIAFESDGHKDMWLTWLLTRNGHKLLLPYKLGT